MHVSDSAAQAHTPADGNDLRGREKAGSGSNLQRIKEGNRRSMKAVVGEPRRSGVVANLKLLLEP